MMRTVLVTGFGRFPGAPFNPTAALVARLEGAGRRHGVRYVGHVFDTSYAAVDRELPALIAAHRPDAIVMLGLAGRRKHVSIELFARNRVSVLLPDAAGAVPRGAAIVSGAPTRVRGLAPFSTLLAAARASRVKTAPSRDAGGYLCNYVYWRALEAAAKPGGPRRAVFVHVPPVRPSSRPSGRAKRVGMTFDQLARAAEAIIMALNRR
jgi:pyroglutamyl-peptidase